METGDLGSQVWWIVDSGYWMRAAWALHRSEGERAGQVAAIRTPGVETRARASRPAAGQQAGSSAADGLSVVYRSSPFRGKAVVAVAPSARGWVVVRGW